MWTSVSISPTACTCSRRGISATRAPRALSARTSPSAPNTSRSDFLIESGLGLGAAISSLEGEAAKREERFRDQMKAEQNKSKVLAATLQQALQKAKDDPTKPLN